MATEVEPAPQPVRNWQHPPDCGCFACALWRERVRRLGFRPIPAKDWRGVELVP